MLPRSIFVAAALLGASPPAHAVTISGTYYEDGTLLNCASVSTCKGQFLLPAETAGQFLTLTEISCNGLASNPLTIGRLFLTDNGANTRRIHSLSMDLTPDPNVSWREPVNYKIAGGSPREINVEFRSAANTVFQMTCTIVGTLSSQ